MQYSGLSQLDTLASLFLKGELQYDVIVLDEASTIAVLDLDTVVASRSAKDASKDPNVPTQPDFFANTERCRRTLKRILDLPVHVIFTAHVREDKDEKTGITQKRPAFSPKLRTTIEQEMHLVGHLTATENKRGDEITYVRKLQVHPTRSVSAKSRIGGLPLFVTSPDLSEILTDFVIVEEAPSIPQEPDGIVSESENNLFEPQEA